MRAVLFTYYTAKILYLLHNNNFVGCGHLESGLKKGTGRRQSDTMPSPEQSNTDTDSDSNTSGQTTILSAGQLFFIQLKSTQETKVQCLYITLTVHVHPDGLDGRRAEAILSLAVVAASLSPQDLCDV